MVMRKYKKRLRAYVNRDDFNDMRGKIDPLEYQSLFITWASLFITIDCENKSIWMYVWPVASASLAITGGGMMIFSFVHYAQLYDIHVMTESGAYLIVMVYQLLLITSIVKGKKQYQNLLQAMGDDFQYTCTRGQEYREKFLENQQLIFKACFFVTILSICTGVGMASSACVAAAITMHNQEEGAKRPLPFPMWIPGFDIHASPVYEVLFATAMMLTFVYCVHYTFLLQSHVIWIGEIACKADLITWTLQGLLVDIIPAKNKKEMDYYAALIKHRMREIIEMHNSMYRLLDDYAAVYKKCILYEQMISSPIICMTAYCFVEKYEAGEIQLVLAVLCVGTIVVVLVPNYLCTILLEKVQSVGDACYDVPFWNSGPVVRPYLLLIMQRSMRPLPLVEPGFADISLETYSSALTRAYSCFNMLRQADFNFS